MYLPCYFTLQVLPFPMPRLIPPKNHWIAGADSQWLVLVSGNSSPAFVRPAPAPTRSGFSYTYELPLPRHRFAAPLFSWSYELLFPQLFCFHNHLRCPRVSPSRPSDFNIQRYSGSTKNQVFCIQTLARSLSSSKKSSAVESAISGLFGQNTPGGGEGLHQRRRG